MRKVILQNMISLDGYFQGADGDISWHNVDAEFNEYAIEVLNNLGGLLFGRVTYELMASYWPTPAASTDDPIVAGKMNTLPKVVFSRTLAKADWDNTRLVRDDAEKEVLKLKQQPGRDLAIFGSSELAVTLMQHGLIDEYRVFVNPVILGKGKSLFHGLSSPQKVTLLNAKPFRSGNVLLTYQPAGAID